MPFFPILISGRIWNIFPAKPDPDHPWIKCQIPIPVLIKAILFGSGNLKCHRFYPDPVLSHWIQIRILPVMTEL